MVKVGEVLIPFLTVLCSFDRKLRTESPLFPAGLDQKVKNVEERAESAESDRNDRLG